MQHQIGFTIFSKSQDLIPQLMLQIQTGRTPIGKPHLNRGYSRGSLVNTFFTKQNPLRRINGFLAGEGSNFFWALTGKHVPISFIISTLGNQVSGEGDCRHH